MLLAERKEADALTRRGVVRLLVLALATTVRHAEKLIGESKDLPLLHQSIGPVRDFVRELAERAAERACLPEGATVPRERAAFEAALERGRPNVVATAERLAASLTTALGEYHASLSRNVRLVTPRQDRGVARKARCVEVS